ncbi:MAG: hypothetical protein JO092_07565 [Candidatus Eremiobacteraeota bacterium]|nr:hypothetical protein [Candidatus Eremiobacteraeota bacterium]
MAWVSCASIALPVATGGGDRTLAEQRANAGLVYAADPKHGEIHIYDLAGSHQKEIGHVDGLPANFGLAVDGVGNVYVAVSGRSEVLVYAPRASTPFLRLRDPIGTNAPWGIAVSKTGDVAVANEVQLNPYRESHVSFFHRGATESYATIANPNSVAECIYVAYDDVGNLYVLGHGAAGKTVLGEIAGGGHGSTIADLHLRGLGKTLAALQVDTSGDVVVAQASQASVFAPQSNTLLRKINYGGAEKSHAFTLTSSGKRFYISNGRFNPTQLWEYEYMSAEKPVNTIRVVPNRPEPVVQVWALAIAPPAKP